MSKSKSFSETDIFRTSSLLLRLSYARIKNVNTDIKKTLGHSFLNHIGRCVEYARLSYNELSGNNRLKYLFICKSIYEVDMAQTDLNLMVSSHFLEGKNNDESEQIFLNGGSEISKHIGSLVIQLNGFKQSIEQKILPEDKNFVLTQLSLV